MDYEVGCYTDHLQRTAFHWAALNSTAKVMGILLAGCRWDAPTLRATDCRGKCALEYAQERNALEVAHALSNALSNPSRVLSHYGAHLVKVVDGIPYESYHPENPYHVAIVSRSH